MLIFFINEKDNNGLIECVVIFFHTFFINSIWLSIGQEKV